MGVTLGVTFGFTLGVTLGVNLGGEDLGRSKFWREIIFLKVFLFLNNLFLVPNWF